MINYSFDDVANEMARWWAHAAPLQCWILHLVVRLLAPPLAWVAPLDERAQRSPRKSVLPEEWECFLRTGTAAAEPRQG